MFDEILGPRKKQLISEDKHSGSSEDQDNRPKKDDNAKPKKLGTGTAFPSSGSYQMPVSEDPSDPWSEADELAMEFEEEGCDGKCDDCDSALTKSTLTKSILAEVIADATPAKGGCHEDQCHNCHEDCMYAYI